MNQTINYVYDALNRLTSQTFADTTMNVTRTYDAGSRLTQMKNSYSDVTFTYNKLNLVATEVQKIGAYTFTVTSTYDKAGNRTKVTYPSGKVVDYVYNALNQVTNVKVNAVALANYAYDPLNRLTTKDLVQTATKSAVHTYDLGNQLLTLENKILPAGTLIAKHTYTYDAAGNRLTHANQQSTLATMNFVYSKIYELNTVTGAQAHSYAYDKVSNRTTADAVAYTSNGLNQYTAVGAAALTYDKNGNLLTDGTATNVYDALNRLTQVTKAPYVVQYRYDGFNRRVSKQVGSVITYFVQDGDEVIEERNSTGALVADYTYGPKIDEVLTMTRGGQTYYYFYDGLGSVRQITNAAGTVIDRYDYDIFGKPLNASTVGNPVMFTGRWYEPETGQYYYRARFYSPTLGRFLQRDPIGYFDSMNLYEYVYNSPTSYVDPYGLYAAVVVKLLKNGGKIVVRTLKDQAAAVRARLAGLNVQAKTRQMAHQIENAVAKGKPIEKHPAHDLPNGGKGNPHYQTDGLYGHTFWSGVGVFMLDLLDPFSADALYSEDEDLDGNGVPDWMDEYNDSQSDACQ